MADIKVYVRGPEDHHKFGRSTERLEDALHFGAQRALGQLDTIDKVEQANLMPLRNKAARAIAFVMTSPYFHPEANAVDIHRFSAVVLAGSVNDASVSWDELIRTAAQRALLQHGKNEEYDITPLEHTPDADPNQLWQHTGASYRGLHFGAATGRKAHHNRQASIAMASTVGNALQGLPLYGSMSPLEVSGRAEPEWLNVLNTNSELGRPEPGTLPTLGELAFVSEFANLRASQDELLVTTSG